MLLRYFCIALLLAVPVFSDCNTELAEITHTDVFREYLKENVYGFLLNPTQPNSELTFNELNVTLAFYFNAGSDIDNTKLCEESTPNKIVSKYNNVNLSLVTHKMITSKNRNRIPRCSDDTSYGHCSEKQPNFCISGILKPRCAGPDNILGNTDDCGCPGTQTCYTTTGMCDVECTKPAHCGTDTVTYECDGPNIKKKSNTWECIDDFCVEDHDTTVYHNCQSEGKVCYDGSCVQCNTNADCGASLNCDGSVLSGFECMDHACQEIVGTDCSATGKFCDSSAGACVDCISQSDCPVQEITETCESHKRMNTTCNYICDAGTCLADQNCNSVLNEDCGSYYCKDDSGSTSCVMCYLDEQCPSYPGDIICNDGVLYNHTYAPRCSSDYCTSDPVDTVYKDCRPDKDCVPGCDRCIDQTLPNNDLIVDGSQVMVQPVGVLGSDYQLTLQVWGNPGDNYVNLQFREYNNTGIIYSEDLGPIGSCDDMGGCDFTWDRINPSGHYKYQIELTNQSGRTWLLPSSNTMMFPVYGYFCKDSLEVIVP